MRTKKVGMVIALAAGVAAAAGIGMATAQGAAPDARMSFFITSVGGGDGMNLGGLAGADRHCQRLAEAAGSRGKTWRAYLSATAADGKPINARDRIGAGPWYNAKGVAVAQSVADLHSANNKLSKENSLTEKGATVNGRGDTPNQHDIVTGSTADGMLATGANGQPLTCNNWTSNGPGAANAGHHDRQGGGAAPTSWNAAHATRSCSQPDLVATGGNGYFYCFAAN